MSSEARSTRIIRTAIPLFFGIIALLLIVGLVFIYSSSSVYALTHYGSANYFFKKHCMGLLIGIIAAYLVSHIPTSVIQTATPTCFFVSLAITALTLIPPFALRINGSSRWLRFASWSFQPSELLKITLFLYLARCLTRRTNRPFAMLVLLLALPSIILLKQPDFGFTVTLVSSALIVCCLAQFQAKRIAFSMVGLIPLAATLIWLQPYRMKRIAIFLNPWHDPHGSGFQIIQSLIAIGSGGTYGIGIGQSRQKFFYLPMQHTDFIFSIIAEETGFIGSVTLVMLYVLFLYFGLKIACSVQNLFARYFLLGFITLVEVQAVINMAVATGLAPTKGIGLPFISYGNTSLVTYLLMAGIAKALIKEDYQDTKNHRLAGFAKR